MGFDNVVVDVGSKFDADGTLLYREATTVYLVTQAGIPELRNSNRLISQYFPSGDKKLEIVLNRYEPKALGVTDDHITKALTRPSQWKIPNDYSAVRRMQNTATPLIAEDSPISRLIKKMASTVSGVAQEEPKKLSLIHIWAQTEFQKMHSFAWWPTLIVLAVATFTDLRSRRIPNWLVLPFMLAGLVASTWLGGWHGLGHSFAGLGLGILIYGFLFWVGGMGAGDVKLAAAIGAWIGPDQLFIALIVTAMAGGIMILLWAVWALGIKRLMNRSKNSDEEQRPALSAFLRRKMPYAPAIAIGTLISFFSH